MGRFDEIINQARRVLFCPFCGRQYPISQIQVRGFYNHTYVIQAMCAQKHPPVITMFVTSVKGKTITQPKALSKEDFEQAEKTIEKFDGDFEKLWKT